MTRLFFALVLAQVDAPAAVTLTPPPPPTPTPEMSSSSSPTDADRIDALEARIAELESAAIRQSWLLKSVKLSGYVDMGFFTVSGNGSGLRADYAREVPDTANLLRSWTFVGDPLSTMVNSRGEPADMGGSRAIAYDPLHTLGRPTFIVNAFNLSLRAAIDDSLVMQVMVEFMPRDRDLSNPNGVALGALFDLKLAAVTWSHDFGTFSLAVSGGKVDSLLGIEYRTQEANRRLTVTPSLLCRYICGRPTGVRATALFAKKQFELSLAVTNGSHQSEGFPFADNIDFNRMKTLAGRAAVRAPVGKGLEVNVSGAVGPQDRQTDDNVMQWHAGVGAHLSIDDFTITAEYVTGAADGANDTAGPRPLVCGRAACLSYKSAYALLGWRALDLLQPYLRVDWRAARMQRDPEYAYQSDVLRATVGARAELLEHLTVKVEYTFNRELWPYEFPDDIFTSSLVVSF